MRRQLLSVLAIIAMAPFSAFAQTAPTFSDCSVSSLTGSSQSVGTTYTLGKNVYSRRYLLFCNTGNANVGINFAGGTAAIGGTGTLTLVPGSCKEYSSANGTLPNPPSNNVNVIGTAAQPLLCIEGR